MRKRYFYDDFDADDDECDFEDDDDDDDCAPTCGVRMQRNRGWGRRSRMSCCCGCCGCC